jgi:hypothetical protein
MDVEFVHQIGTVGFGCFDAQKEQRHFAADLR